MGDRVCRVILSGRAAATLWCVSFSLTRRVARLPFPPPRTPSCSAKSYLGRFVWGSDWPHTRHEHVASYAGGLAEMSERIDDSRAVWVLYGLS